MGEAPMTRYRIADSVAWVSREDLDVAGNPTAYVTLVPHGGPITLEGSACLVWLAVADGGTLDDITTAAAAMSDQDAATIAGDVEQLIAQLIGAGLVAPG